MKKLLFGLALAAIAVGGSSFTSEKRDVTENFLIQPIGGIFIRVVTANGSCINLNSGLKCKYVITDSGKENMPSQLLYTSDDIQEFLNEGWLEQSPTAANGLYFLL